MMNELLVEYARVSTERQDLTAQRNGLCTLGVGDDRIYQREAQPRRLDPHDPTDPVGGLLFNVLAMIAELETDLIRMRWEGMKVAKANGRLRGQAAEVEADSGQASARAERPRHPYPGRTR
jgi:DNA invertase Pin-like site-specific DNA recombinase